MKSVYIHYRRSHYQYWPTEYIGTNGRPTGLAAAFLGYLSNAVALNDLADAGYAPAATRTIRARPAGARSRVLSTGRRHRKSKG
jgi:hypothetical protein